MPEQPQQCVTIAGQYVIPSPSAHPRKKGVDNIVTWVECFVSYMSVITAHMPHRSRDLLAHLSLILRTSKRFGGNAWLNYDRAFRQEAATTGLQDWSGMKADLYNYHTAGAHTSYIPTATHSFRTRGREPVSSARHGEACRSWNRGHCTSPRATCIYQHICDRDGCFGSHRRLSCPRVESNRAPERHRPRSPFRPRHTFR